MVSTKKACICCQSMFFKRHRLERHSSIFRKSCRREKGEEMQLQSLFLQLHGKNHPTLVKSHLC